MKRYTIFIYLFFLCRFAQGQESAKSVVYTIDSLKIDSFYLVERIFSTTGTRPDTLVKYTLFRDTTEFRKYINLQKRVAKNRKTDFQFLKLEFDSLDSRAGRLEDLGSSKFGFQFGNKSNKSVEQPPEEAPGFWVIYPVKGKASAVYVTKLEQIEYDAIILNPNGTTMQFKKPVKPGSKKKK